LTASKYGVAYIYFEHKQAQAQKAAEYIASLLRQLEQQKGSITPSVQSTYNAISARSQKADLKTLKDWLVDSSKSFSVRTFIVLDAFDECSPTEMQEVVETLKLLMSRNDQLSIFISSRPNSHLDNLASSFPTEIRLIKILTGEGAQNYDLRAYLKGELTKARIEDDENLVIEQEILEKAKGLYHTSAPSKL